MTKEELLKVKQDLLNLETSKLSGYPTIDKPWTINYNQKELEKEIPKRTVFQEIYNNFSISCFFKYLHVPIFKSFTPIFPILLLCSAKTFLPTASHIFLTCLFFPS